MTPNFYNSLVLFIVAVLFCLRHCQNSVAPLIKRARKICHLQGAARRVPSSRKVFIRDLLLLLLSFPKVVVGNLFLLLLFSYATTDPRLNSLGMTTKQCCFCRCLSVVYFKGV
ncbi:hypothetical protein, partial [Candidatus Avelusimicrobium stercoris]|uniref:hypothetical protein n=1 Tax=Candidatus Avelusimicrobium stercoris TaxID=1947924 RepID=UPI003D09918B